MTTRSARPEAAPLDVSIEHGNEILAPDQIECAKPSEPTFLHSPPDSNKAAKSEGTGSNLSELGDEPQVPEQAPEQATSSAGKVDAEVKAEIDDHTVKDEVQPQQDEDIGEVFPDHWSGGVPVFKPTMHQFRDFQRFMLKVDSYGMKSGIIKIIPPSEWKDMQPELDELVKGIRVREPIKQDIMGREGTYRQMNILHNRSYDIPRWRQLCEQSEHQPPARRGERRANTEKAKPIKPKLDVVKSEDGTGPATAPSGRGRGRGRGRRRGRGRGRGGSRGGRRRAEENERPMTPVSPALEPEEPQENILDSVEQDVNNDEPEPALPVGRSGAIGGRGSRGGRGMRGGGSRGGSTAQTQSTSARRKYSKREGSAVVDEAAFKDFDYRMDISDYTEERCEELERSYWKTLTYAPPLYGADMMGTLFDDRTTTWNLNKLPNLLDVLGSKIPGVNTAYLYLGMWKATFAWHLEDVDLYSINYVHFGAPKQWYAIKQADARKFEAAMKNIWPQEAKACNQFLRHKAFLISPQTLLSNYGIRVNKVLSYPGEFVVTYPYGYHSGYNLGYNCAEAVNFALDPWLEMGKIAKKCECAQAQDSVWIDVHAIERKLKGEETEYEETEDESEEDEDDDMSGLPTPPASHGVKFKRPGKKRKRGPNEKGPKAKVKKIRLRLKNRAESPCCLCPNNIPGLELLDTDNGQKAHRLCALYLPETYIDKVDGKEMVSNTGAIHKDRLELKCLYCRSKKGACFQCSQNKCTRSYHPSCAAPAGVFVEDGDVPVWGEDGTEYKEQAFEFSCRYHRTKRDKKYDGKALEDDERIRRAARALQVGDICQLQYYRSDIWAGMVIENRPEDETLIIDAIPHGDRVEVEWKWLLLADPLDYHLPKASANAIPLPDSQKAKDRLNAKRLEDDKPRKEDPFVNGCTWAEFHSEAVTNKEQAKIDFSKDNQVWYYLPKTSTDARDQYTENPRLLRHNPRGNFLETVPKPVKPAAAKSTAQYRHSFPSAAGQKYPYSNSGMLAVSGRSEKPYVYKPKMPSTYYHSTPGTFTTKSFAPTSPSSTLSFKQYHGPEKSQQGVSSTYSTQSFGVQRTSPQLGAPASIQWPLTTNWQRSSTMSSNGQKPPAPVTLPQSTTAMRPTGRPSWQIYPEAYAKYPFFQVHHNRDLSKYKTPYGSWGGFTNGYQGDMRTHLIANQSDFLKRPSPGASHSAVNASQYPSGVSSPAVGTGQLLQSKTPATSPPRTPRQGDLPGQASIKARYTAGLKHDFQSSSQPRQSCLQNLPVTKAYKAPLKQSPVPLPANFLAAMTSTTHDVSASAEPTENDFGTTVAAPVPEPPFQSIAASAQSIPPEKQQEFPDFPGGESMEFMDRMMANLRSASLRMDGL